MKVCISCSIKKDEVEFNLRNRNGSSRKSECKPCEYQRTKRYRLKNPIQHRATVYKITKEKLQELLNRSAGQCEICRREYTKPYIDHDHITGEVRGVLCLQCNMAIGLMLDDPDIFRWAVEYIERHRNNSKESTDNRA
jgi:hypothetical protein